MFPPARGITAAEDSCRMRAEGLLCASVDPLSYDAGDACVLRPIHTRSALAVGFEQAGEPWKTSGRPTMPCCDDANRPVKCGACRCEAREKRGRGLAVHRVANGPWR
ncbi:hypothetical protein GY45DRAFT_767699 [Cubamyces sp. BRFM 1775]|nr:hypothetical protein GY45DRAFT_767699 [Cubamyces sp. BRFM 1775]